ncbi:SNARE associated Golgi protein [bacterium BMS3Abin10]|nr:SNARE associated Golgi protein [bacterium BMS3Abin10]GBE39417.1 SNARE associated Golgi protein [bacterium BMS3Bbin08]
MNFLKKLYDWVLHWAETPNAMPALFLLAFAESSFFPIPPDVLLITLALSIPSKSFRYAAVCTAGSVLGGVAGYFIGYGLMDLIGTPILEFYGVMDKYEYIQELYMRYDAWAVSIAGFTPVPYKVFTISAGAFKINFVIFVLASLAGRAGRFFLVAALIYRFGPPIRKFIDKYFNLLTIVFFVLLILGFIVVKYVF